MRILRTDARSERASEGMEVVKAWSACRRAEAKEAALRIGLMRGCNCSNLFSEAVCQCGERCESFGAESLERVPRIRASRSDASSTATCGRTYTAPRECTIAACVTKASARNLQRWSRNMSLSILTQSGRQRDANTAGAMWMRSTTRRNAVRVMSAALRAI